MWEQYGILWVTPLQQLLFLKERSRHFVAAEDHERKMTTFAREPDGALILASPIAKGIYDFTNSWPFV
jgi:hypothetical protein